MFLGLRVDSRPNQPQQLLPAVFPVPEPVAPESASSNRLTQLVYEAAHTNIHNHPQRQEHEQHGRPTITH